MAFNMLCIISKYLYLVVSISVYFEEVIGNILCMNLELR